MSLCITCSLRWHEIDIERVEHEVVVEIDQAGR